jgi:hypothetical protein
MNTLCAAWKNIAVQRLPDLSRIQAMMTLAPMIITVKQTTPYQSGASLL